MTSREELLAELQDTHRVELRESDKNYLDSFMIWKHAHNTLLCVNNKLANRMSSFPT